MAWNDFSPAVAHFSARQQKRVREAFELGEKMHRGQTRRSGEPYFSHPIAVARMVAEMGADPDTVIAALLHDTVEDTPLTVAEVENTFNGSVGTLIDGMTKLDGEAFEQHPTLNEQAESLRKMFRLMQQDVRVMVIKLADRLHNMQTIEFLPPEKQQGLARETADVYAKIAGRLSMQEIEYELEQRSTAILEPELYRGLMALRAQNIERGERILPEMQRTLEDAHPSLMREVVLRRDRKSWAKLREQHARGGVAGVTGIAGVNIAFICPDRDACYRVLGALHEAWRREAMSFQDYINSPLVNGYRGLHTTVILKDGTRVRCKIRTVEMDEYARRGVTTLCFNPRKQEELWSLLPWTQRITPLTEDTTHRSDDFWQSLQNDILGRSMTIHGPDDRTAQLPLGATALDAAFYLFGEAALGTETVKVNGKDVPLNTALHHADSIDVTFGEQPAATREWLDRVTTSFATACIRGALGGQSDENNLEVGRMILQRLMDERKTGYLDEFNADTLGKRVAALGYASLDEALIALATGRLDALALHRALFQAAGGRSSSTKRPCFVRFRLPGSPTARFPGVVPMLEDMQRRAGSFSLHSDAEAISVRATMTLTRDEQERLIASLRAVNADGIRVSSKRFKAFVIGATLLLSILWGLDPVIARFLIVSEHISAIDFTILRFWTMAAAFIVASAVSRRHQILKPLNLRHPLLWASSLLMLLVALTTYAALQTEPASHYETVMAASGILVATVLGAVRWRRALLLWVLLLVSVALLLRSPAWSMAGGPFLALSLLCFAGFLAVSNRYMQLQHVAHRSLQYYTAMVVIASLCSIPLFAFATPAIWNPFLILRVALFSVLFIGVPYYLYYEVPPKREADSVIPFASLMLTATLIGEALLSLRLPDPFTILAFAAMVGGIFILQRKSVAALRPSSGRQ